ncbi:hypothetical protein COV19_02100 [Candidatus Woesearchaeota archaeon CG10_big_fil_rev_8_21_14_0_10_44_13]|nr:MAG: hypothetical protein COV19_02100 [Candidatus Woesearchaeota archaeon CG10_big_fil_rev_8_21_14_0_10_44_13]
MDEKADLYPGLKLRYAVYIIFAVIVLATLFFLLDYAKMPTTYAVYDPTKTDQYLSDLDSMKDMYNSNLDKVPAILRRVFGNERLNVTLIRMDNSRTLLAIKTKRGKVDSINLGEMQDPTMQLEIRESTMKRISESDDPAEELNNALDSGEIKYKGEKITSSVKTSILEAVVSVISWF